ncbi:MAG: SDR family oxidoreductase [Flavobacteriales bacterium]|nr:SDR family oxidoreductase [Flavobacteriales bacterium]NNK81321.1 SDR family oxidoreductase [Flavobacteriales bacterium]
MSRVVLITGASSGIGKSMAHFLRDKGLTVYGTSRKAQNGEIIEGVQFIQMDVTDSNSVKQGIDFILSQTSRIDILVNNAGIGMVGSVEDSMPEEMKMQFETNYYGPLRTIQAVLPIMREQGEGYIINISSLASLFGLPYRAVYCAAKSALNSLTETLTMEVKQFGVKVVVLCPGDYKTGIKSSRIHAAKAESSVYAQEFKKVLDIVNEEVDESGDPIEVAKSLWKVINKKNPKPYYIAASPFQKFVVHLRYWLPTKAFQWLMMRNYKMLGD